MRHYIHGITYTIGNRIAKFSMHMDSKYILQCITIETDL